MPNDELDLTSRLRARDDDPPPEALLAAARAAYSWRTVDTDLCRPSYDSLLDEALTSVRGSEDARLLRFESDALALDLEVAMDGDRRSVVGQLTPAGADEVTVWHGGTAEVSVTPDGLGRFVVDDLMRGPLSIRCGSADGGTALSTDWVLV